MQSEKTHHRYETAVTCNLLAATVWPPCSLLATAAHTAQQWFCPDSITELPSAVTCYPTNYHQKSAPSGNEVADHTNIFEITLAERHISKDSQLLPGQI